MHIESTLTIINSFHKDLKIIKELVYDKCGFDLTNPKLNQESIGYGACSFELNGKTIEHRFSKITPTKIGQFVAIWKRNDEGITEPYDIADNLDFLIITARSGENLGQFIFPKSVLAERGIITKKNKEGKRGIRVYPPWDIATNKQAKKTQSWQVSYFMTLKASDVTDINLIKGLIGKGKS